jgi:hypothetical protein
VKLVHLVRFITKKFVTMHGHMNVFFLNYVFRKIQVNSINKYDFFNDYNLSYGSLFYALASHARKLSYDTAGIETG